ncbi:hypothetical protein ACHAXR_000758, partial [Thalassiosira sp. AJA248-18]
SYDEAVEACVKVHFHGFADLPAAVSKVAESPQFTCFGNNWVLDLYPGGIENSSADGYVSVYLFHRSHSSICVDFDFIVKDSDGIEIVNWAAPISPPNVFDCDGAGAPNFAERSIIIDDALIEGTLVIEVRMKLVESSGGPVPQFIPENPLCKNVLKKFMDGEFADVLFEVGSESEKGGRAGRKRAKTSPIFFHAHNFILQDSSSTLADLCKSTKKLSPIQITDVKPDIFRHMLYYIYGGQVPEEDLEENAKDIIDATDKYGVVNLKLEAEACYARTITLTIDNMIDNLLYADSKNCALLKEVVMDFIVENGEDIIGNASFESVPGSMMMDLVTAMTRGKQNDNDSSDANNYKTMR